MEKKFGDILIKHKKENSDVPEGELLEEINTSLTLLKEHQLKHAIIFSFMFNKIAGIFLFNKNIIFTIILKHSLNFKCWFISKCNL